MTNLNQVHFNQHGQKIGVKHYLETKIKPRVVGNIISYPLYMRVTARRQTTKLKSNLDKYVPLDDFESFKEQYANQLEKEVELTRNKILATKPFDKETFSLSAALNDLYGPYFDLSKRVQELLQEEVKNVLAKMIAPSLGANQNMFELEDVFIPGAGKKPFNEFGKAQVTARTAYNWQTSTAYYHAVTIASISDQNSPMKDLLNSYPVYFWQFPVICSLVAGQVGEPFFTLQDWLNGNFRLAYEKVWRMLHIQGEEHADLKPEVIFLAFEEGFKILCNKHRVFRESFAHFKV